jgi:hypothetical protein
VLCDDVRDRLDILWEAGQPAEVGQHLAECPACSGYYRDLQLLHSGFRMLQREKAPEPSLGFAERLVRQLGNMSGVPSVAEFCERVGRRFVYSTFVLTLLALLALALPSSGPVRSLGAGDIQVPAQEASLIYADPIGETGLPESLDQAPANTPARAATHEAK